MIFYVLIKSSIWNGTVKWRDTQLTRRILNSKPYIYSTTPQNTETKTQHKIKMANNKKSTLNLLQLPEEALMIIMIRVGVTSRRDLGSLRRTCKAFLEMSNDDLVHNHKFYLEDQLVAKCPPKNINWWEEPYVCSCFLKIPRPIDPAWVKWRKAHLALNNKLWSFW